MDERIHVEKKPAARTLPDSYDRILVGRREAARMLSISQRSSIIWWQRGNSMFRKIGARVLIPINEPQAVRSGRSSRAALAKEGNSRALRSAFAD